jgi:hypothetical protein
MSGEALLGKPWEGTSGSARCVGTLVECRVYRMLNAMDDLGTNCDGFDDGALNASCQQPLPSFGLQPASQAGLATLQVPLTPPHSDVGQAV